MTSISARDAVQLLSSTDDGDDSIATAVMNGEMDIASAIEALGELDDAELKQELLSAAVVGGATLLERRRNRDTSDTDEETESITVDIESSDEESTDTESSSRLVTLPRLAFVGIAAGVTYAVVKYRKSQSETTQSTFDDVAVDTATEAEDEDSAAADTNATASTESLVDEDAEEDVDTETEAVEEREPETTEAPEPEEDDEE